jgi:predicted  nucleic acid-binding Zn-ribbon protein
LAVLLEIKEKPMGWMRTLFQGDIGQNLEIEALRERLDQMRDEGTPAARTQKRQIEALQEEMHELKLRLGVLIKLLVAKNLLTAEEIASMIAALEPEDSK